MDLIIRIAVMGMTGSGKSTFIKTLIPDADIAIGGDMNSQTTEPESFMAPIDGMLYELVDTPGFGDTRRTDAEVLRCISEYFAARHASGELFHGVIYLHSLAHTRVSGSMRAQIRAFKAICGNRFFSRVVIGSTFWEATTDLSVALANEQQLFFAEDGFFEDVIDLGAQTTRVFQTYEACIEAVRRIPDDPPLPLQIQSELGGNGDFNQTSAAAAVVSAEQRRLQEEHEQRMREEEEAAERQRLENERLAALEALRIARANAEAERQRLLELQRREREYQEAEERRRATERQQALERQREKEAAEERRCEAERLAIQRVKAEKEAEDRRRLEEERKEEERRRHERRMQELRAEEEAKQERLRRIARSKEGFRKWHISWYHSSFFCMGSPCWEQLHDGMQCWDCERKLCFSCYRKQAVLRHNSGCHYYDPRA